MSASADAASAAFPAPRSRIRGSRNRDGLSGVLEEVSALHLI